MYVYSYVTVETEDRSYEDVVAVQSGDVLGIVPDPTSLEREYGPGGGQPERLFKSHARYVVPLRRVVEIDRGGEMRPTEPDARSGDRGTRAESTGARNSEDGTDDDPENVFDEV